MGPSKRATEWKGELLPQLSVPWRRRTCAVGCPNSSTSVGVDRDLALPLSSCRSSVVTSSPLRMHCSRPKKLKTQHKPLIGTSNSVARWQHNDGDVLSQDHDLGIAAELCNSRYDFERGVYDDVKRTGRPERPVNTTLATALIEEVAWQLAVGDDKAHDGLYRQDRLPEEVARIILERVGELCRVDVPAWRGWSNTLERTPFDLWLDLALRCGTSPGKMRTYRGLVLADEGQLTSIAERADIFRSLDMPRTPIVVLLDLSATRFCDEDALTLKRSVGSTLAALRLDGTRFTSQGLANLAMATHDDAGSFCRLRLLSLRDLCAVSDSHVARLANFPSLAAIGALSSCFVPVCHSHGRTDLRSTGCTMVGIDLLRRGLATRNARTFFHSATAPERHVFASKLSLSSSYERLCNILSPGTPSPLRVLIRELRRDTVPTFAEVKREVQGRTTTMLLGDIYSAQPLHLATLAEDQDALRKPAAFRVGSGGLVARAGPLARPALPLPPQVSDGEEDEEGEEERFEGFYGVRGNLEAEVPGPSSLLLFRNVQPVVRYVAPMRTVAPLAPTRKMKQEANLEPIVPKKRPSTSNGKDLLKSLLPVSKASLASPRPTSVAATQMSDGKAARKGLNAFSRKSFSAHTSTY